MRRSFRSFETENTCASPRFDGTGRRSGGKGWVHLFDNLQHYLTLCMLAFPF
jgi:hypothetical protein